MQLIPGKLYKIHKPNYRPFYPFSIHEPPMKEVIVMVSNIDTEGTITFFWKDKKIKMTKEVTYGLFIIEEIIID